MNLTENEQKVIDILTNHNSGSGIWIPISDVMGLFNMDINELEIILYSLQLRGLIRLNFDGVNMPKITTEEKIQKKLSKRKNTALRSMGEALENAVENEEYEDAAKLRDWLVIGNDSNTDTDELINKLLEDIDNQD